MVAAQDQALQTKYNAADRVAERLKTATAETEGWN
jgi:hypothetical protein